MVGTLKKAYWLLRSRPAQFASTLRGYLLFSATQVLQRFFMTPLQGIFLGENVRVQKLKCLSAEKPNASIHIGSDSVVYENAQIEAYGNGKITIGEGSIIGDARIYSRASIRLGSRVVTSWNVFIQDFDPHPIEPELRAAQMRMMTENFRPSYRASRPLPPFEWKFPVAAIEIGDDVWLGANTTVLKGARIGAGSIVATGSVVTAGDYPPRSILGGAPARVLKTLPEPKAETAPTAEVQA